MEKIDIKKLLSEFETLSGKIKDAKDFNFIITNILKKKTCGKNTIEILVQFLNNLTQIKNELKSHKKLEKTIYAILFTENGEEKFIKQYI